MGGWHLCHKIAQIYFVGIGIIIDEEIKELETCGEFSPWPPTPSNVVFYDGISQKQILRLFPEALNCSETGVFH